ncbi:MAG: polysaccharide pyruvyl transferase CsaB [Oscillospiraceae bacterium]|jgi:polysaccharide pyruvyl transferase CsaB|nr:polysaccharide pyruvyl transferase CsaB [Oscillospiraceae bacterium]
MSRVLLATMSLGIGGAETHITELARELTRRGHDITVVSAGGVYVEDITGCGAKHFTAPLNTRRPRDMARALGALSFLMKTEKYDIVHAHARIPAFLCGLLKPIYKFRFVTTAHWVFNARGPMRYLTNWGEKTLAVSEDIKAYLLENYRVKSENITVTVNGVNTERFSPGVSGRRVRRELGIPETVPAVVNVSRLDKTASAPVVAVRELIGAAPALSRSVPKLRIIIVGGGDAEGELREFAEDVNAECGREVVMFTGGRTDVEELLAVSDLFVGVSRAAIEAMSCGKPVILAGSEGYLGLLSKENSELAVKTNFTCRGHGETSAETLAEDIAGFFREFGKPAFDIGSARLGAFGRELVTERCSVARMTDDCERVYAELLSGRAATARPRRRVVMSGYYGFNNAGDEAIMQAVHGAIAETQSDAEITVLSKNPRLTRARYGYKAVNRFNPASVLWALRRCDALVFGGGSLLQDHTSTRSLLYYLAILSLARSLGRRVMIYANGIGPVTRERNRRRVRRAVESADVVTLRDERSREELVSMGVARDDMAITSDPVFTAELPAEDERREILAAVGPGGGRRFAVVSVRQRGADERFVSELARFCDMAKSELGIEILLLPMQPPGDLSACRAVSERMEGGAVVPPRELTLREYFGLIGEADFAVSMRLHTLIFAARTGTPPLGIDIDPKLRAYLDLLGAPNLGTPEEFDAERALSSARAVSENRAEISARLERLAREQGERARTDARLLAELIDGARGNRLA